MEEIGPAQPSFWKRALAFWDFKDVCFAGGWVLLTLGLALRFSVGMACIGGGACLFAVAVFGTTPSKGV